MTRYDPHPQAHDDARTTPHGFTSGPSAAQNGSGVLGDADAAAGLREALERLLEFPNWTYIDGLLTAVLLPEDLRAVLAAHPAGAPAEAAGRERMEALIERSSLGTPEAKRLRDSVPREAVDRIMARVRELDAEAPEPSGDVVERAGDLIDHRRRLRTSHGLAQDLADAGLLIPDDWSQRAERVEHYVADLQARLEGQRDEARARVAELEDEVGSLNADLSEVMQSRTWWVDHAKAAEARARRASWCVCSWRSAPWCLLDNLLACRVRWVCDRHDRFITGGQ